MIRPGLISTLYTHCDNYSAVQHSTLMPYVHHLPSSISIKNPSEYSTIDQHQTYHDDAWPAEQIMVLSAASSGIW